MANVIRRVLNAGPGNYLVAFPSFEYLRVVRDSGCFDAELAVQKQHMSLEDQASFIGWINTAHTKRVGFVVLGGVFTESIDYRSDVLRGVVVVGPGIPPSGPAHPGCCPRGLRFHGGRRSGGRNYGSTRWPFRRRRSCYSVFCPTF